MNKDYENQPRRKKRRVAYDSTDLYNAIRDANKIEVFNILKQRQQDVNLKIVHKISESSYTTTLDLIFAYFKETDVMEILEFFFYQSNFDVDRPNSSSKPVLHLAVICKMKKAIEFLLERNASILMHDDNGNFITHHFIENEHIQFNERSYAGNFRPYDKSTMEKESISFVEWLISKGFDFDYENRDGIRALDLAIKRDLQHIIPSLLKHTSDMKFVNKKNKRTLLHSFLEAKNYYRNNRIGFYCPRRNVWSKDFTQRYDLEIVNILLNNDVSVDAVDSFGKTALHIAVERELEMDIVEMLLERFTNVHHKHCGQTLLHIVIEKAGQIPSSVEYFIKIIRALIAKGALIKHEDHSTIMDDIIKTRSVRAVELMKDIGVDFNTETRKGQNLLHKLIAFNTIYHNSIADSDVKLQEVIFDFFVTEGCDVNKTDDNGQTPLHWAVEYGNEALARKLIASGADVQCRDKKKGDTALHLAVARDKLVDVAELLLDKGVDVNIKNHWNERPLYLSILNETNSMSKMLLKRGAYVDVQCNMEETALSHAVCENQPASIEELFKYGADYNHPDVTAAIEFLNDEGRLEFADSWVQCMLPHWARLKAAKLLDRWTEWEYLVPDSDSVGSFEKYSEEIEKLKSTFIDSRTSLYQFLHMDIDNRCYYIKNVKLLNLIESELLEKDFPNYYIVILGSYREAVARKSLLEPAKEGWFELTDIDLPDICIERVLSYLSNADLVVIIERNETMSE